MADSDRRFWIDKPFMVLTLLVLLLFFVGLLIRVDPLFLERMGLRLERTLIPVRYLDMLGVALLLLLIYSGVKRVRHDVSRRRSAAALADSERRYGSIFESAPVSIMEQDLSQVKAAISKLKRRGVSDLASYIKEHPGFASRTLAKVRILDVNAQTLSMFDAESKEDLLVPLGRISDPATLEAFSEQMIAIADGRRRFECQSVVRTLKGRQKYVLTSIAYPDAASSFERVLVSMIDVTERKAHDDALREANQRLEEALAELKASQSRVLQSERLRALGEMASGIAHDFNNTLSPILGFAELLLARPEIQKGPVKFRRYLSMIRIAAKDGAAVVRRLRDFYRPNEANEERELIDLKGLVETSIFLTRPKWRDQAIKKGVTIHIDTDLRVIPPAWGNGSELRDVLTNLIMNSVDAMPTGGEIRIAARAEGKYVLLEIQDTGTGMSEEVQRRCLEPYFSTKCSQGTGLGLALVHGIVRRHDGRLSIKSAPDVGTRVTVKLPKGSPEAEVQRVEEVRETASPRPIKVLLVDDDPAIREVVGEFLFCDGHSVETASSGIDAWEKFCTSQYDLVLTDQGMPGMCGDELASLIQGLAPDTPVILLTGFGDIMMSEGANPPGIDLILSKPISLEDLRGAVAMVLDSVAT